MNESDPDGIFPMPAAALDRFLLKVLLDFPSPNEELEILERFGAEVPPQPPPLVDLKHIRSWRAVARTIYCAPAIRRYIVEIVCATRKTEGDDALDLDRGAGPRACLALLRAGRAKAMLAGRNFVLPADVRGIACAALRHRVVFSRSFLLKRDGTERRLLEIIQAVPRP